MSEYFSKSWQPQIEFWLKTRCPGCGRSNFLPVGLNDVKDIDAFECHSCDCLWWLRPRWSVEDRYGHYLKSEDNPEGYENFNDLLSKEKELHVVKGVSKTMSIVKAGS